MITHRNVFKCLNSWLYQLNGIQIRASDRWIGYLPLAHILELLAEMMMLVFGIPIGYSSPNTLTDKVHALKYFLSIKYFFIMKYF